MKVTQITVNIESIYQRQTWIFIFTLINIACHQGTPFILACYSYENCKSLTEARHRIWSSKIAHFIGAASSLASLPPTAEVLVQNLNRAHLQVVIDGHSTDISEPNVKLKKHGW